MYFNESISDCFIFLKVQLPNDVQQSPKPRSSQAMQAADEVFFARQPNVGSTNFENNSTIPTKSGKVVCDFAIF